MLRSKETLLHGILSLADQVLVSGSSFVTIALISQSCSAFHVGEFALAWTIVSLIRTVQERAIAAPYLAFTYRPEFSRPSYRGSVVSHQVFFALTCGLIGLSICMLLLLMGFERGMLSLSISLACAAPFILIRDQMRAVCTADSKFAKLLVIDVCIVATQLTGILLLFFLNKITLARINGILGIACVIPIAYWFLQSRSSFAFDWKSIASDWRHNWSYSRWLVVARMFGIAPFFLIPWFIALSLGLEKAGAFGNCMNLVGLSQMFIMGVNNMFQPKTVRELQTSGTKGMFGCIRLTLITILPVLLLVSIAFFFLGDFALGLIYGKFYADYGWIAFLMSVSTLAMTCSVIYGNGLAALGASKEYFRGEFLGSVVSILFALLLVPRIGLQGAPMALVLGGLASSITTWSSLKKRAKRYDDEIHDADMATNRMQELAV
jgi:O-antigen/teichoic acid export membrane protein